MTRPKDFIFNSDYLALAQSGKNSFQFDLPAKTMQPFTADDILESRIAAPESGAIDRFYLSTDGTNWNVSSSAKKIFDNNTDLYLVAEAYRDGRNNIRLRVEYTNKTYDAYTFPATTIYVRLSSFKPPNVL